MPQIDPTKLTQAVIEKYSIVSNAFRDKNGRFVKGHPKLTTLDSYKKMILSRKGYKHSKKTKQAISNAHKGKKHFPQQGFQKGHKFYAGGEKGWRKKGVPLPESSRLKISGKNSPRWQGGKSFEPYTTDWNNTLKRAIRERDNYICQICSQYGLEVHHINYDKKNCNPNNLITLCKSCHAKTNLNRNYWNKFLCQLLN